MNDELSAEALRRAFDRAFAEAPRDDAQAGEELVALQLGGEGYLLPLAELSGLVVGRRIVALPTTAPAFLGVVGIRGTVVPVYDLGALLGHPRAESSPRWLAISKEPRVGFAFDRFVGQVRRPRADSPSERVTSAHVREAVRISGVIQRVIDVRSVLAALATNARASAEAGG